MQLATGKGEMRQSCLPTSFTPSCIFKTDRQEENTSIYTEFESNKHGTIKDIMTSISGYWLFPAARESKRFLHLCLHRINILRGSLKVYIELPIHLTTHVLI